jgi:hypothetical protein
MHCGNENNKIWRRALNVPVTITGSVVDPHYFDGDFNSTFHPEVSPDAGPDPDFYLMRMRIQIRLFALMRI